MIESTVANASRSASFSETGAVSLSPAIAHSRNTKGERQSLQDHLANVAHLTSQFAHFAPEAAAYLGWTHDLGKLRPLWQQRILDIEAFEEGTSHVKPVFVETLHDHKMSGAAYVYPESPLAGLLIAGHHGGLPDFSTFVMEMESAKWASHRQEIVDRIGVLDLRSLSACGMARDYFSLMMLYSSLVDADCVDTSSHYDRLTPPAFVGMAELHNKLLNTETPSTASLAVHQMRQDVRQACLAGIAQPQGLFSLPAPTGSGKTISGGLWATGHAAHHGLGRFIYVAPFRTIIDQTSGIYSDVFGEQNVLPHHSTADFWTAGEQGRLQRQLAENWDLPCVVTTSEQSFESAFAGSPSAARKLHNIANSVVVIDEIQALPVALLTPCLSFLKVLVEQFGCSVMLMSATVPPLEHAKLLAGSQVTNILPGHFDVPERVTLDTAQFNECYWSAVGEFMSTKCQALCIANTKKGALRIYDNLPPASRVYLSTWLCPSHRKSVVSGIKQKLTSGKNVHVSSTQVIEAGVDLDFPDTLLREMAPLDSIVQAAGRCNRNGHGKGEVFVFSPVEGNALRDYSLPISVVKHLLHANKDLLAPETLQEYYALLYNVSNLDEKSVMKHVAALNFETIREGNSIGEGEFQLIEQGQVHLVVEYGDLDNLHEALDGITTKVAAGEVPHRWATRRIQHNVVSVFPLTFGQLCEAFPFATRPLYLNYFTWLGAYDEDTGLGDVIASLSDE
jgi:CRISPR-associated endonuclease/helicase Cas3